MVTFKQKYSGCLHTLRPSTLGLSVDLMWHGSLYFYASFQSISAINQLLREDLTNRLQEEVNESSRGFQCGMEAQENAVIEVKQWAHDIGQEAETFLNPKHMFPDKKQFERGVSHEEHAAGIHY